MNKYVGTECPVCHAKIFEEDDIVVCPDCGAPYHRRCWEIAEDCVFKAYHGTAQQYQPPKITEQEPLDENENTENSNSKRQGFRDKFTVVYEDDEQERNDIINRVLLQSEVHDGDTIDGESTRHIALYISYNAKRYIRAFKEMIFNETKAGWNWLAFLFPQYWLLSRKCYKAGSLVTAFELLSSLMIQVMNGKGYALYNDLAGAAKNPSIFFTSLPLLTVLILMFLSLIIHIFLGIFGDNIYKRQVLSSVKQWRESDESDDELELVRQGGVNLFIPALVYIGMDFLVYAIASFIV